MRLVIPVIALALAFGAASSIWAEDAKEVEKVAVEKIRISYCSG